MTMAINPLGELTAALHEAHDAEVANILKLNSNLIDNHCSPPWLHLAIAAPMNQFILLNLLLDAGAPLEATDKFGATALHVATGTQQSDCLGELLKRGAFIDARDRNRKTAIHYAAHNNSPECLDLLLTNGCSRDVADNEGKTSLHIAAREGALAAVNALLLNGASPKLQDHEQRTPLHLTRVPGVAKALVNAGADVTAPDAHGHTPLSNAVDRRPAMVPQLLTSGMAVHGNINDTELKVFLNLDILMPLGSAALGEMSLLRTMAHRGQYDLLKHPICETFLQLKWLRVYPLFIVKIFIFFGLTI
ncbi:unnamed protein product [Meganyctiphanes norvegica]|uniref:Uncharacterized protein n=1 Tax=Meganyctiphanes norvegica TaxID=48144 RepID=A0AAV2R8Q6_MEGNR